MSLSPATTDTPAPNPRKRQSRRRLLRRLAHRTRLWERLEWGIGLFSLIAIAGSYWLLTRGGAPDVLRSSRLLVPLILVNLLPLLGLAFLVFRRLAVLRSNQARGFAASRLHLRMVRFFAMAAIVPTVLLALFAGWLFDSGFQFWFSDRVQTVITNANQIAQAYVEENKKRIEGDVLSMARDLNAQVSSLTATPDALQTYVVWQAAARNLSEAIVFSSSMDVKARASFEVASQSDRILEADLARANAGEVVVLAGSGGREDRVQALIKLDSFFDRYLYVSRKVSPQVLNQVINSERALSEYQRLTQDRRKLQLRFIIMLVIVSLLLLVTAVLLGMWSANRLTAPVGRMVKAAGRIGAGDFSARLPSRGSFDELGVLARALNRMAAQVQAQTRALMNANEQIDNRRRFTETVLSGVSAGVLGLSRAGVIALPNRSAADLLGQPVEALIGARIQDVAPEMGALLDHAVQEGASEGQISLALEGGARDLLVRIAADSNDPERSNYVATFDDVTEQIANQRRAAWSDVARRIAHEIKNPLTPIQLSAERLRRKYRGEISSDIATFDACTETIIRQVGDLRKMVDEFSSFARMPRPTFHPEDLVEILRQCVFLQELVHPGIQFRIDLADDLPVFICDRRQIAQAVTNLLKNAAEAVQSLDPERGQAGSIWITAARHGDRKLEVAISDTGPGLPADLRQRLTEPYVTTRARGTGLGLAIVKKIVEDHAGELTLEDRAGGGAIARMLFELRDADMSTDTEPKKQAGYGA